MSVRDDYTDAEAMSLGYEILYEIERWSDPYLMGVRARVSAGDGFTQNDEVLPTTCNCTEDGLPYCGRPECDVDWCHTCGDEYSEPCPRHAEVGRP